MSDKYLLVDASILPSSYLDVLRAREMIEVDGVSIVKACQENHISRSTYYKYRDLVFLPSPTDSKKANLSLIVDDVPGTLSNILEMIYLKKGNILSINQTMPLQKRASISITLDIKELNTDLDALVAALLGIAHVRKVEVIAHE